MSTGNRTTTIQQVTGQKPWYCDVQIAGFLNSIQESMKQDPVYKNVKPGMRNDKPDIFMISFTHYSGASYTLRFNSNFRSSRKGVVFLEDVAPPAKLDCIDLTYPLSEYKRKSATNADKRRALPQSLDHLKRICGRSQGNSPSVHGGSYGGYGGYGGGHAADSRNSIY